MKSEYVYKMALRNISRNKRRTALSAIAIALAVLFVVTMKSYMGGIWGSMTKNIYVFETAHIKIQNKDYVKEEKLMPLDLSVWGYEEDYNEVIDIVKKAEGVTHVFPRTRFGAILNLDGKMKSLIGFAFDPELEKPVNDFQGSIKEGRIFEEFAPGKYEMVIGKVLANELNVKVGDKLTLMTKTAEEGLGHMTFKIVGISSYGIPQLDKMYFYIPLSTAAKFLKMEGEVIELAVYLDNVKESIPVSEKINSLLEQQDDNPYEAYAWEKQRNGLYYNMLSMMGVYDVVFLVFLVLASLVIINTTMMVIYERMKEIGTISALGMRGNAIVKLFFYEAAIISTIGSFFGMIGGGVIAFIMNRTGMDIAKLTGGSMEEMGMSDIIYWDFGAQMLISSFIFGVIVACVCAYIPSRRAAKIEPATAMKGVF